MNGPTHLHTIEYLCECVEGVHRERQMDFVGFIDFTGHYNSLCVDEFQLIKLFPIMYNGCTGIPIMMN